MQAYAEDEYQVFEREVLPQLDQSEFMYIFYDILPIKFFAASSLFGSFFIKYSNRASAFCGDRWTLRLVFHLYNVFGLMSIAAEISLCCCQEAQ